MERFKDFTGQAVAYLRENVDTDQIIPKQFLTSVTKTGYGLFLFNDERWLTPAKDSNSKREDLTANEKFVLNQKKYEGAQILIAGQNFGCGSSREHAVWALTDFGFKAIIAPSFADIFSSNASKNGLLLIELDKKDIANLAKEAESKSNLFIEVVLSDPKPYIKTKSKKFNFTIDSGIKNRLLAGLDEIAITEQSLDQIKTYEQERQKLEPWLELETNRNN